MTNRHQGGYVENVVENFHQQVPMRQEDMVLDIVNVIKRKKMKAMTTAKQLAYKAYMDGMQKAYPVKINPDEIMEGFENWWSEHYSRGDHKDSFRAEINVYVDGKRYIQAE